MRAGLPPRPTLIIPIQVPLLALGVPGIVLSGEVATLPRCAVVVALLVLQLRPIVSVAFVPAVVGSFVHGAVTTGIDIAGT